MKYASLGFTNFLSNSGTYDRILYVQAGDEIPEQAGGVPDGLVHGQLPPDSPACCRYLLHTAHSLYQLLRYGRSYDVAKIATGKWLGNGMIRIGSE